MCTVREHAFVHRKRCDLVCYHLDNCERGHQKQRKIYVSYTTHVQSKIFMPFCTGDLRNAQREWRELYRP